MLAHVLGLDDPTGRWYLWWSGPGADLGELAIVAVIWHHLNCRQPGCWRVARHRTPHCMRHREEP